MNQLKQDVIYYEFQKQIKKSLSNQLELITNTILNQTDGQLWDYMDDKVHSENIEHSQLLFVEDQILIQADYQNQKRN